MRDLLPSAYELSLSAPTNVSPREAPLHDQRRLGIWQSLCRIQIPTDGRENPLDGVIDKLTSHQDAFDTLTCGPGKSVRRAVEYWDDEILESMLQLSLHVQHDHTGLSLDYSVGLSRTEWSGMVYNGKDAWVAALDELINRRSDRAYYHVRNRMAADYGEQAVFAEEAQWGAQWGSKLLRKKEKEEITVEDVGTLMRDVEM